MACTDRFKRLVRRGGILSLILLVAASALCFSLIKSGAEYKRARDRYLELAALHAKWAQSRARLLRKPPVLKAFVDLNLAEERYHRELERKYLRAAARPWIPVEPDPPSPKFPVKEILEDMKRMEKELEENYWNRRREVPRPKQPLDII